MCRSEWWEACVSDSSKLQSDSNKIVREVRKAHLAMDKGVSHEDAVANAFVAISNILNMEYKKGEAEAYINNHPALQHLYKL